MVTWEGAWLKHSREHRSFLFKCSRATICNRAWKTNLLIAALPFSDNRGDDSCSPDDTGARPEMRTTRLPSFLPSLPSSLSHLTVPEYRAQHPCHGDRVPMTILRKGGGKCWWGRGGIKFTSVCVRKHGEFVSVMSFVKIPQVPFTCILLDIKFMRL